MTARESLTLDLFETGRARGTGLQWPEAIHFPLNIGGHRVENQVWKDLIESVNPLVVAGYASLDRLIDFVCAAGNNSVRDGSVRLLFGHEPFQSRREEYRLRDDDFPATVERYWLEKGISLIRSAGVIQTIELLKSGTVQARYVSGFPLLHAKIYCGDNAVTLGSSNFTEPGLTSQLEANTRFTRSRDVARFRDVWLIANNYWQLGRPYNEALVALLEKLLKVVSWKEALARACAELLEGEWAKKYLREDYLRDADSLWPSQKQGIAQALAVISSQDSVLIADATGAGKTRMGIYLIGAVRDDILRRMRLRRGNALMVCPPSVINNWERESVDSSVPLDVYSHGRLSHTQSKRHSLSLTALRRAQILCVDEGHNFLNLKSNRTHHLLRNMADHVVMLTATPINRSVVDLLRIADMLGADNLEPETLEAFKKMLGVKRLARTLTEDEIEKLRREIQKFTVRRTKRVLNQLIDREPMRYTDINGKPCRFPKHIPEFYPLNEPESDRLIAVQIKELCDGLRGVTHFVKPIEMPDVLRKQGVSEESYLRGRLSSATKLARYIVMSSLRSSRAALLEHVSGTNEALSMFDIQNFTKAETGNMKKMIANISGMLPKNKLHVPLPDWLSDLKLHRAACEEDLARYEKIATLTLCLSDSRERHKAELLSSLHKQFDLLLAFDTRPISLAAIRNILNTYKNVRTLLASGDETSDRAILLEEFALGSKSRCIGLCSDSLSEGVNLQQAQALVHLDMPSVVRIAEQRAGRVDRMDSPHKRIEVWWPDDAPEFALSTDEKFIERFETVEKLLGSNMPLPEHLQKQRHVSVSTKQLVAEYEKADAEPWDGIDDAFSPVRALVSGEKALVNSATYEHYRSRNERILSRVSLIRSAYPWAFFCLTSGTFGAPRWVLIPSYMGKSVTVLSDVANALRERLGDNVKDLKLDDTSSEVLQRFLKRLPEVERMLLSRKKQRALDEMGECIKSALDHASKLQKQDTVDHLTALQNILRNVSNRQPDWDEVAARWLDVIRPVWFERLNDPKRKKPLLLRDILPDLQAKPEWLIEQMEAHFQKFPVLPDSDERVRVCIVGVG